MPTEYHRNPTPPDETVRKAGDVFWGIPLTIAAVILIAAILILGAGPDRTRTADFNAPNSVSSQAEKRQIESGIPPSGGATGTQDPAQPQKSNPEGTQ